MGLREEKKQELRQEILAAALRLIRENGYDATRIQDITEQVRISEATFFNYFPSKEALLQAFGHESQSAYDMVLEHVLEERDKPVRERLREIATVLAYHFSEDRDFFATVVTRSNFFFAPAGDAMHEHYRRHHDLQTELLRQGQLSGEIRRDVPAGQLAEVFTAVYLLAVINWLTGSGYVEPKQGLEPRLLRAIDVFVDGCVVPRGRARARAHIRAPAKPRRRRPARKLGSISK